MTRHRPRHAAAPRRLGPARRALVAVVVLPVAATIVFAAPRTGGRSTTVAAGGPVGVAPVAAPPAAPPAPEPPKPASADDFDPARFPDPTTIDNRWVPLVPGTRFVYEGKADIGDGLRPHRVVTTVTDLTKVVGGVRTLVVWDRDYQDGRLIESELAFEAQDADGNVWNLGEYPEEYERGRFQGAPSTWITGVDGATAGLLMQRDPAPNTPEYREGFAPTIEFGDRASVFALTKTCAPVGCFDPALVIDEFDSFDPAGGHQRKYYGAGVGNVAVEPAGGREGERLALVAVDHLDPAAVAAVRVDALKLEQRGRRVSRVYRQADPIHALHPEDEATLPAPGTLPETG